MSARRLQPPFIHPSYYQPGMAVPPVPAQFKYRISKELAHLYYELQDYPQFQALELRKLCQTLTPEQALYVRFWWNREYYNPEWRNADENQGKPLRAHLTLVKE